MLCASLNHFPNQDFNKDFIFKEAILFLDFLTLKQNRSKCPIRTEFLSIVFSVFCA